MDKGPRQTLYKQDSGLLPQSESTEFHLVREIQQDWNTESWDYKQA